MNVASIKITRILIQTFNKIVKEDRNLQKPRNMLNHLKPKHKMKGSSSHQQKNLGSVSWK